MIVFINKNIFFYLKRNDSLRRMEVVGCNFGAVREVARSVI